MSSPSNNSSSRSSEIREWLNCPICKKPSRPLNPAPGQTLNRCESCKVTFFDKGEFGRSVGNGLEPQNFTMAFAQAVFKEQFACPRCAKSGSAAALIGYSAADNRAARFALCASCGGIAVPDNNIAALNKVLVQIRAKNSPAGAAERNGSQTEPNKGASGGLFFQQLAAAENLFVKQRFEALELFTALESRNKYEILDQSGNIVAYAAEQSKGFLGFFGRNLLGQFRSLEVLIFDAQREIIARARMPFRFYFRRLNVVDAQGRSAGFIERRFSLFSALYSVHEASGAQIMEIKRPWFRFWKFTVFMREAEVGLIEKKWSGALRELFTNEDFFKVSFSPALGNNSNRILVLLGALIIDIMHFEQKN